MAASLYWNLISINKINSVSMNEIFKFKVACVVNIIFFFMDWFYYELIILIK